MVNQKTRDSHHQPVAMLFSLRVKCCVCKLEDGLQALLRKTDYGVKQLEDIMGIRCNAIQLGVYNMKWIACCLNDGCTLYAHYVHVKSHHFIFKHPELQGKTCFEIALHENT